MRTEFWCIQRLRPAGPSALDKHQIQASALDLLYLLIIKLIELIPKFSADSANALSFYEVFYEQHHLQSVP